MRSSLLIAAVAALLAVSHPASSTESTRKKAHSSKKEEKKESGASCKAPEIGACSSCAITCRPGETATCGPGTLSGDLCARPPSCTCK